MDSMDFHSFSFFKNSFLYRFSWIPIDFRVIFRFFWISIDFHGFPWISMDLNGSGTRMSDTLCQPVPPCAAGLDPPNIKISDSGGLGLEAWCLHAWMLAGLEWIGGGDGGDGILGGGDWKKFSHAQASGARRINSENFFRQAWLGKKCLRLPGRPQQC